MKATPEQWKRAGLFMPYHDKEWTSTSDPAALRTVNDWIDGLEDHIINDGKGLLLMGEPGRGKTLLAHMAADAVVHYGWTEMHGVPKRDVFRAVTVNKYLDLFHKKMDMIDLVRKNGDDEAGQQYMQAMRTIEAIQSKIYVVMIDDIGKEHSTTSGYSENQVETMIRSRGNKGLPTIITTNLDPAGLEQRYGPSFSSYLLQVCVHVSVFGLDHRRARG